MPTPALWQAPLIHRRLVGLPVHQSGNDTTGPVDDAQIPPIDVVVIVHMNMLGSLDDDAAIGRIPGTEAQDQRSKHSREAIHHWAGRTQSERAHIEEDCAR